MKAKTRCFMWPHLFSKVADEVDRRYGLKQAHLAKISEKNFSNAKKNPNAQSRNWTLDQRRVSAKTTSRTRASKAGSDVTTADRRPTGRWR